MMVRPLVSLTLIEVEIPVIDGVAVSVALMVWKPPVMNVTEKVPVPFISAELAGRLAWGSELEKRTVPEYVVATLFAASSAVTVKFTGVPEFAEEGVETEKCVAASGGPPPPGFVLPAAPPPHALQMQTLRITTDNSADIFIPIPPLGGRQSS